MLISIILVNYNGIKYNRKCIDSILNNEYGRFEISIIVVDNASSDESMNELKKHYQNEKRVKLLYLDDNYGFSYANNRGIERAISEGADYLLLLNNDTEIACDMIEQITKCASDNQDSVISPKIYYASPQNRIWYAGGEVSRFIKKISYIGQGENDIGQYDECKKTDVITGCAVLFPRSIINRIGMLDERFFLYFEDTEWSFRIEKNNLKMVYCPEAIVYHKVSGSTNGNHNPANAYYIARNWLIVNKQYLGKCFYLFVIYFFINRAAWCCIWVLSGHREYLKATKQGIHDFRKKIFGKYIVN